MGKKYHSWRIKNGGVPEHVAIIMDGNRRWSKKLNKKPIDGHKAGFNTLKSIMSYCFELEIHIVTVYAFSVDNFGRSKEEVENIMDLAETAIKLFSDEMSVIMKNKVRVSIFGDLKSLTERFENKEKGNKLLKDMCNLIELTKQNDQYYVNVCFAYSSRLEMLNGMDRICILRSLGLIDQNLVDHDLFMSCLYSKGMAPPDLLIRTSGEKRLSDFLLYQLSFTPLFFTDIKWPDFNEKIFVKALYFYQKQLKDMKEVRDIFNRKIQDIGNKNITHSSCSPSASKSFFVIEKLKDIVNFASSLLKARKRSKRNFVPSKAFTFLESRDDLINRLGCEAVTKDVAIKELNKLIHSSS